MSEKRKHMVSEKEITTEHLHPEFRDTQDQEHTWISISGEIQKVFAAHSENEKGDWTGPYDR